MKFIFGSLITMLHLHVCKWIYFKSYSDAGVEEAQVLKVLTALYTDCSQGSGHSSKYKQQISLISGLCLRELGKSTQLTTGKQTSTDHSEKQRVTA